MQSKLRPFASPFFLVINELGYKMGVNAKCKVSIREILFYFNYI